MQGLSKGLNFGDAEALVEAQGGVKSKLIERQAIFESVAYLLGHGFNAEQVERCLVSCFYVDLDLLNEALTQH